jgi:hypothetical protein
MGSEYVLGRCHSFVWFKGASPKDSCVEVLVPRVTVMGDGETFKRLDLVEVLKSLRHCPKACTQKGSCHKSLKVTQLFSDFLFGDTITHSPTSSCRSSRRPNQSLCHVIWTFRTQKCMPNKYFSLLR